MLKPSFCLMIAALTLAPLSQAQALCLYKGVFSAKTTIAQEFADSRWVVRARVTAQTDSWADARIDDEAPWTLYRVEILEAFKGNPPAAMKVFTMRDSGGFYLEPRPGEPDHYVDYLLFPIPKPHYLGDPAEAAGTAIVNYSCGMSKPWNELTSEDIAALNAARRR